MSKEITDYDRLKFMGKLATSDLNLSDWEQSFIASFRSSSRPSLWFTAPRRRAVDRLRMQYGSLPEINMAMPDPESKPRSIPDGDPGCCQFMVRNESGRQVPCNEPATSKTNSGFRYCDIHADQAVKSFKFMGKTLLLSRL